MFLIQSVKEAKTFRILADSQQCVLNDLHEVTIADAIAMDKADSTIKKQTDAIAFRTTQADMLAKENRKLERSNNFWRYVAGIACTAAVFEFIRRRDYEQH